jgi:hypothetical protein
MSNLTLSLTPFVIILLFPVSTLLLALRLDPTIPAWFPTTLSVTRNHPSGLCANNRRFPAAGVPGRQCHLHLDSPSFTFNFIL